MPEVLFIPKVDIDWRQSNVRFAEEAERLTRDQQMTPEEFQRYYPRLLGRIDATLRAHAEDARTVVSRRFPRLPLYFSVHTLSSAKVVLVDQLPIPPLSSWGLTRFADFERGNFDGITYLNTFFIKRDELRNEATHFHELIQIVQWRILGPEQFLRSYADGLERLGYRDSPLEVMAHDAEAAFIANDIFDAEQLVARKLS
ncbi:MAG: hypothetical protein WB048_05690 [Pseudolabrys sp.]